MKTDEQVCRLPTSQLAVEPEGTGSWRMNHIPRFSGHSFAAAVAVVAIALLAGCGSASAPPTSSLTGTCLTKSDAPLALAIGARSNVPAPRLSAAVSQFLETTAGDGQQIALIRIDGQPKVFAPARFATTAQNTAARNEALLNYINTRISPILQSKIRARAAQADILTALDLAAAATSPNGNIVVIDSGLQTLAPLNFSQAGVLSAQPNEVVAFLRHQKLLPNLKGRHVLLSGFGYTAAPQPALNIAQRSNVVAVWEAIVRSAGGCVTVDSTPNTAAELSGLPSVNVVRPPAPPVFSQCGTVALSDAGTVGFTQNTATFRDPVAAHATLQRLASRLKKSAEHIKLIGSTSSEGAEALNLRLSLRRALAVKGVLVSLGIPVDRITAVGDGSHWPGRVTDIGPGGELLPGPAEQDREVIVQFPKCK
jgi:OmpA-OmpF porin, OOP family